jgi:GGDEF domain-containing protein
VEILLKQADAAMYEVKQSGRGRFKFFHELDRAGLDE